MFFICIAGSIHAIGIVADRSGVAPCFIASSKVEVMC